VLIDKNLNIHRIYIYICIMFLRSVN